MSRAGWSDRRAARSGLSYAAEDRYACEGLLKRPRIRAPRLIGTRALGGGKGVGQVAGTWLQKACGGMYG